MSSSAAPLKWEANQWVAWRGTVHSNQLKILFTPQQKWIFVELSVCFLWTWLQSFTVARWGDLLLYRYKDNYRIRQRNFFKGGVSGLTDHNPPSLPFWSTFKVATLPMIELPQILARLGQQGCTCTHLQGRNTKIKFMSRILEKIYVGSETGSGSEFNWKVGSGSEKIIPDPQHRLRQNQLILTLSIWSSILRGQLGLLSVKGGVPESRMYRMTPRDQQST